MGLYATTVLPHLIDLAMRHPLARERRAGLVPQARGTVLEVGIGSGLNVPFYSTAVDRLYGIDPCPRLLSMARARARSSPFPVDLLCSPAEEIPVAGASIDTVVMTWTLCSIPHPASALGEIRRVLKPGGRLLFVEHGLAPDPAVQRWQCRLTPLWSKLAGGCHLDRRMDRLIESGGFRIETLSAQYLPGPRTLTYFYQGAAVPA